MADETRPEVRRNVLNTPQIDDAQTLPGTNVPPDEPAAPYPKIPGYDVLGELGRGGMGVVYEAWQRSLNRTVALKMIRSTFGVTSAEISRFLVEAEAIASIRHPNVVQVFECGKHEGYPYIVLEYVPGGNLSSFLRKNGPLDPRLAAELVATIAAGVQAAHDAGIIHRDLKPANILLGKQESKAADASGSGSSLLPHPSSLQPKVSDFGIARRGDLRLTVTGMALGTPEYVAPEQASGGSQFIGPAADVYAMGVILFELLAGRTPFDGRDTWMLLQQVMSSPAPSVRKFSADVPRDLELICHKCLEKEPHHRYASATELANDLRRFLGGKPVTARPLGPVSRVWRGVRRNPLVAGLTAAVVLSSTIGGAIALVKANEADRNATVANDAAEKARTEEANGRVLLDAVQRESAERQRQEEARKAADAFALRTVRVALYSRELGDVRRILVSGDVSAAEQTLMACEAGLRGWEWRLMNRWLMRRSPVLPPTGGPFTPDRVAVSQDGRWIAASGAPRRHFDAPRPGSNSVWLWDLKTGSPPVHFRANFITHVRILAINPDTGRILALSDDALRVWDLSQPEKPLLETSRKLDEAFGKGAPRTLAASLLADRVLSVVASPTTGSLTKLVTWSFTEKAKPESIETIIPGSEGVVAAAIAPDGKSLLLAGGGLLRRVGLDGKAIGDPVTYDGTAAEVAFAPDGKGAILLLRANPFTGGVLTAWDGKESKLTRRLAIDDPLQTFDVRRDGRVLIATIAYRRRDCLRVWEPATGAIDVPARFGEFGGAASFPDSRRIVVGDFSVGTRLWDPADLHDREIAHPANLTLTALSGDRVAMTDQRRGQVWVRPADAGMMVEHTPDATIAAYDVPIWAGEQIAVVAYSQGYERKSLLLYDPTAKTVSQRWELSGPSVVAANQNRIAFATLGPMRGEEKAVEIHDAATGNLIRSLPIPGDGASIEHLVLSPDGKRLAVSRIMPIATITPDLERARRSVAGWVSTWDVESGAVLWVAEARGGVVGLSFSADGSLVAGGGRDGKVRVWRTEEGKTAREFAVPMGELRSGPGDPHAADQKPTFSPDGTRLAGAGTGGITIWDLATGQPLLVIPTPASVVSFSADGRRLLANGTKKVLVYDAGPP